MKRASDDQLSKEDGSELGHEEIFFEYGSRWQQEVELAREFADLLSVEGIGPFLRERTEGHFWVNLACE